MKKGISVHRQLRKDARNKVNYYRAQYLASPNLIHILTDILTVMQATMTATPEAGDTVGGGCLGARASLIIALTLLCVGALERLRPLDDGKWLEEMSTWSTKQTIKLRFPQFKRAHDRINSAV
ncbi:hypothetical protein ANO14919_092110 [Xylariales sp. No.14919]|nr:hypothetical protein ANO14919_092110 [Xylariales sp. No.14919]